MRCQCRCSRSKASWTTSSATGISPSIIAASRTSSRWSRTAVSAVTLAEFVQGGTATVERHGYESMLDTGYHPPADEGWKVVARAEFLLKLQHRLPYNLIGHNCEIIANMCASRNWTESYQVRRWFGRKAAADVVLLFGIAALSRAGRSLPRWAIQAIIVWVVGGYTAIATYNDQIRQLPARASSKQP
jgi:Lecithin retinol acyltransferase